MVVICKYENWYLIAHKIPHIRIFQNCLVDNPSSWKLIKKLFCQSIFYLIVWLLNKCNHINICFDRWNLNSIYSRQKKNFFEVLFFIKVSFPNEQMSTNSTFERKNPFIRIVRSFKLSTKQWNTLSQNCFHVTLKERFFS